MQTSSTPLQGRKCGRTWTNDGSHRHLPTLKNTANLFRKWDRHRHGGKQQVAIGKDGDSFWTDVFPRQLVDQFSGDINKFGRVLKIIKYTMPVLGQVPVRIMLKMFFFRSEFCDRIVFPVITFLLGTGSQTANISCAILESLFDYSSMDSWDYSSGSGSVQLVYHGHCP